MTDSLQDEQLVVHLATKVIGLVDVAHSHPNLRRPRMQPRL